MENKIPDNVVNHPGLMTYGTNVGAPAIYINNIESWKTPRVVSINKYFNDKFNNIKNEYEKLIDEYKWNDLVYKSKFNFEPIIGETYHLYYDSKESIFLSLINPNEWKKKCIGSFKYDYNNKWIKI
jgi:hypothetical protein